MAESIYTTLSNETINVTDKNQELSITLPDWLPNDQIFESVDSLYKHCEDNNMLHAILQSGIKHEIIALRAAIRPTGQTQKFEQFECQDRADSYRPTVSVRPNAKKAMSEEDMLKQLLAGMGADELKKRLTALSE